MSINLFEILNISGSIDPKKCKLHLACWNGTEDPLDVYFTGGFEQWQAIQSRKNFERDFIVSLIKLKETNTWLYVGCFTVLGSEPRSPSGFIYKTEEVKEFSELSGRLVVDFVRTGRQPYLTAENWVSEITVREIRTEKLTIGEFPGYRNVHLNKRDLDLIISNQISSWKAALSSLAGVYLITDHSNGKLYVGKASGDNGIWQRWSDYSRTGHGGNVELKSLLSDEGEHHLMNLSFSILEILDIKVTEEEIIKREIHWKKVLSSIPHGYNKN